MILIESILTAIALCCLLFMHQYLINKPWYFWTYMTFTFPVMYIVKKIIINYMSYEKINEIWLRLIRHEYTFEWFERQWFGKPYINLIIKELEKKAPK